MYDYMEPAFAGMKADSRDDLVETFNVKADTPIDFGVVVGDDASGDLVAGGGTTVRGLLVHSHVEAAEKNGKSQQKGETAASVLLRGKLWALVDDGSGATATSDGDVYYDTSTGMVADTATGNVTTTQLSNAVFRGDSVTLDSGDVIVQVQLGAIPA